MSAFMNTVLFQISRLTVSGQTTGVRCLHTAGTPLCFHATNVLSGEPLKKKKKINPQILINKQKKKIKLMEKSIKKLEKHSNRLKPVEEIQATPILRREIGMRTRETMELDYEEKERRALLLKDWSRTKMAEFRQETAAIFRAIRMQEKALEELKLVSEDLYLAAIQTDPSLIPLDTKGPVVTPPDENYDSPDGDYHDTTRVY